MKAIIVYVLTSSPSDIYLEQAFVSMYSLKHHMPEAHIVMLTDSVTEKSFTGVRKTEIKYVDEMVVIDIDANKYNGQQRSRILKTSVRKHVKGDFLFIDCDTIITKPLYDIEGIDADIAACWDTHSLFKDNPYRGMCIEHAQLLGWNVEDEKEYFNSGVIYVKDSPIARQFYELWNQNWLDGLEKGVKMDQPTLALTNFQMGHIIKTLPDIWNCELKHGIRYLKDAYIVHYLCTNPSTFQSKQLFILNEKDVLMEIKKTGCISEEIKETIKDPFYGLAETTHVFAGEDVYFFQSDSYKYLRSRFKRGRISIQDKWLLLFQSMGVLRNKIFR